VGGAKNAVLPLMAAALLARGETVIENVPDLRDVRTFMKLLELLGARCVLDDGTLRIDTATAEGVEAPYELVRTMRASVYVLGPLLAARGRARVSLPGGCAWGPRPVNLHLEGMRQLGARIDLDQGYIVASAAEGLRGGRFRFEPSSVGATANVLMAAALADGTTELLNCAVEPEVTVLAEALQGAGARIAGVDEAGRGPLAGPVVAAAVILDETAHCPGIRDSKKMTPSQRERAFWDILGRARAVGLGLISQIEIDRINILQASLQAMIQAVTRLDPGPDFV